SRGSPRRRRSSRPPSARPPPRRLGPRAGAPEPATTPLCPRRRDRLLLERADAIQGRLAPRARERAIRPVPSHPSPADVEGRFPGWETSFPWRRFVGLLTNRKTMQIQEDPEFRRLALARLAGLGFAHPEFTIVDERCPAMPPGALVSFTRRRGMRRLLSLSAGAFALATVSVTPASAV